MTQITGIGFSNFRVFSKPTFFSLAPITIFTGTNSSGKSSVFKGLQLLTNNSDSLNSLDFSGKGHNLGTFQLAKCRSGNSDTIRFTIKLDDKSLLIIDYKPTQVNSENGIWNQILITLNTEIKEDYSEDELLVLLKNNYEDVYCYFNITHVIEQKIKSITNISDLDSSNPLAENFKKRREKLKKWGGNVFSVNKFKNILPKALIQDADVISDELGKMLINRFTYRSLDIKYYDDLNNIEGEMIFDDILTYLSELIHYAPSFNSITLDQILIDTPYSNLVNDIGRTPFSDVLDDYFVEMIQNKINVPFKMALSTISKSTKGVNYIEAVRANSQRLYSNQSQGTSFNELLLKIGQNWNEMQKNGTDQIKFVEKWIKRFGIGDKLNIGRVKGIATEVTIEREGAIVDLIDLGYGVTQFLPILLYICTNTQIKSEYELMPYYDDASDYVYQERGYNRGINKMNGPLLLIEEPESNLHPKLQSLLADFFIDVAKTFEVTLLIETHSEYLIRRLQVLTAAGEVKSDHSLIYYLDGNLPSNSENFVRQINIKPDGSLTNDFGSGFIDEATNWKLELMRLRNAHLYNVN